MKSHTNDTLRESDRDYGQVLALIGRYRIARTYDGTQWMMQRLRSGERGGKAKWDAVGYCRSPQTLARMCLTYLGEVPHEVLSLMDLTEVERAHV